MDTPNYYAIIPADVRYSKDLSGNEKVFYAELTSLADKDGYCCVSNKYFAELYECAEYTITRWVSRLEKLGFVSTEYASDNTRKITVTPPHKIVGTSPQDCGYPPHKIVGTPPLEESYISTNSDNTKELKDLKNLKTEELKELTPSIVSPTREIGDYIDSFEELWLLYPKKAGKQEARKAWAKLKPSAELATEIMERIALFKTSRSWLSDDGQFIPHLSTFLNNRRWEDEVGAIGLPQKKSGASQNANFKGRDEPDVDFDTLYRN